MAGSYDVIVIGSGLGGLTAAALLARAGRKTLLIERNHGVGGAASTYKASDLIVEASLHATSDPRSPIDPKHDALARAGVLDAVEWVATGSLYEVRGGPVGPAFVLPDSFDGARRALAERFASSRTGIGDLLREMEQISTALGVLSRGRRAFRNPIQAASACAKLGPLVRGWRLSLTERLERALGSDEGAKCALAANLTYWHDDPDRLWWVLFAVAQGGHLATGGRYIRGGSQRLSNALARSMKAAGGELLLRRTVSEVLFDDRGRPCGVTHEGRSGGERAQSHAPIIIANAAPAVLAAMLPPSERQRFWAPFTASPLSISLFSATFGLNVPPAELGFRAYSTFLLPAWMRTLADYRLSANLLAGPPGSDVPILTVVDYTAIDSGLKGPPYAVSVVGVDKSTHWSHLDSTAYEEKRVRWRDAVVGAIDNEFPGFAANIAMSVFSTAGTMQRYLNAPEGAVYGFAPLPPERPIWRGQQHSPRTTLPGLYLASSYAGSGGYSGAILAGRNAADLVLTET